MPCCDFTLGGISQDCNKNQGGILGLWLANRCYVTVEADEDQTTHDINSITQVAGGEFKKYEPIPQTSSFTTTWSGDVTTGADNWTTTLTAVFKRMASDKSVEMEQIAKGGCCAIVQDANKNYWYLGFDEPLQPDSGTQAETGTARNDLNGYTLVLLDYGPLPYFIPASIAEAAIANTTISGASINLEPVSADVVTPKAKAKAAN